MRNVTGFPARAKNERGESIIWLQLAKKWRKNDLVVVVVKADLFRVH